MPPHTVYAPAYPDLGGGPGEVRFEIRMMTTGEMVGIGFSDLRTLVAEMGDAQPWVSLPLEQLEEAMGAAGIGRILLDPALPADGVRWTEEDLLALFAEPNANPDDVDEADRRTHA